MPGGGAPRLGAYMRVAPAEDKQAQMDSEAQMDSDKREASDLPPGSQLPARQAGPDEVVADGVVPDGAVRDGAADPDAAWRQLDAAFDSLEAALAQRQRRWEGELKHLRQELEAARADNARLKDLLKAERARVQRLEDLTSAVSGRVDSAIGELESILDS